MYIEGEGIDLNNYWQYFLLYSDRNLGKEYINLSLSLCDVLLITQTYIIEDLMPFTNYSVSIAVSNTNDTGNFSETVQNRTCEGPEVDILSVTPECPSSLVVVWEVPANLSRLFTPPEEVSFIVMFSKSDGSGTAMYLTVNRTVMENETVVSSICVVFFFLLFVFL